jgi:hypothetical protein
VARVAMLCKRLLRGLGSDAETGTCPGVELYYNLWTIRDLVVNGV